MAKFPFFSPDCVRLSKVRSPKCNASRQGSVALEFALLSPVFLLLLLGVVELCLMEGAQQMLESASYNATRLAKTGYITSGQTQDQSVKQILTTQLASYGLLLDPNKVTMTQTVYSSFSEASSGGGTNATGYGAATQIVGYKVTYPWNIFTPLMCSAIGSACKLTPDGNILNLTSTIVVRNEPYSS